MASTNNEMVDSLLRAGFASPSAAKAMRAIDRALFVPPEFLPQAYLDLPLPIGFGQTISAPGIVAIMSSELDVSEGMKVLEVGTGSGYQAAILSWLAGPSGKVVTVERVPDANETAKKNLERAGAWKNVEFVVGDGSKGWKPRAPFDRVIVTAASPTIPAALVSQLKEGGKMVIPVGSGHSQELVLAEKKHGKLEIRVLLPVVFVPLIGEQGFQGEKL